MNNKKKYIIFVALVLVALFGIAFAYFNYYKVGLNRELIAGDIYLNMDETGGMVTLTNMFPETAEMARKRTDNVINFTIDGRNTTTNKTIWYEIMLDEGDNNTSYTTRVNTEDLRFDLVEINDGVRTMVVDAGSYSELDETRIWVNQVNPNTTYVERQYELRVWVTRDLVISDTDPFADYSASTWKDTYASVKVSVYGDFEEKTLALEDSNATPATCFSYQETSIGGDYTYPYVTYDLNTSTEGVTACKNYFLDFFGGNDDSTAGDGYQTFCEGTGTIGGQDILTLDFYVKSGVLDNSELADANIITNYKNETRYYTLNTSDTAVNTCMDYMLYDLTFAKLEDFAGTDESDAGDGYQTFCQGTGTFFDNTLKVHMENGFNLQNGYFVTQSDVDNFVTLGVLTVETPVTAIEITDYNASCGTDVVIPSQINGMDVVGISINDDTGSAFYDKGLTSVVFPNTMIYINNEAFWNNNITTLEIPSSVTSIGERAFQYNPLVKVNVKGNPSLGSGSFFPNDDNYPSGSKFEAFKYGGTCAELNQYESVIASKWNTLSHPELIITKDGYSCVYDNYGTAE